MSPGLALQRWTSSALRALTETISPLSRKASETRDRLVEQAAGIVAQIEDEALELVAGFFLQLLDRVGARRWSVCSLKEVTRI